MGRHLLLALVLTAGCASSGSKGASVQAEDARDLGLAPVRAPLVFPAEQREVTLAWLVDALMHLTGQELVCRPEVRTQLEACVESLEVATPVPSDEVYAYVESLLAFHGFVLAKLKEGTPTMLAVDGPGREGMGERPCVLLEVEEREALARHPALLFQVTIRLQNLDSRQVQTQLRQLLVDPLGFCNVVPSGDRALIVQGYGARLAGLVQLLLEVDSNSAAALPVPEPRGTAQTQAEQPPPGR